MRGWLMKPGPGRGLVFLLLLFAMAFGSAYALARGGASKARKSGLQVEFSYAWPEYNYPHRVEHAGTSRSLAEMLKRAKRQPAVPSNDLIFWRVTIHDGSERREEYGVSLRGDIYDTGASGSILTHSGLKKQMLRLTRQLDRAYFGKPLTWPEVAPLFPVGGTAMVRDLETGKCFTVRRHRGDSHADIEPLTAEDTRILKEIYGGEWSWRRRAVVVSIGGQQVAGSMNGMPHGWGDLENNQFRGHFCIHFSGSRVHTTWRQDPGHQLMVLKSSGFLASELSGAPPERIARHVLAAIHQRETATLRTAVTGLPVRVLLQAIRPIRHLTIERVREVSSDGKTALVQAEIVVYYYLPDPQAAHRKSARLTLVRRPGGRGWQVEALSLKSLYE